MLPTFVIGLREGLEAALIVGIIAAFLRKQGRPDLLRWVFTGIATAVVLCVAAGIALNVVSHDLPQKQQEGLETVIGALAVAMVTYMVVWMKRNSRGLKGQLEGLAADAMSGTSGAARAMILMAFLAVLREGVETVVFLLAAFNQSTSGAGSAVGACLGLAVAIALGYGIYRGGVRINLSKFFRATGLVLVLVAAGIVVNVLHTAHEAGWLDAGQQSTVDLSWLVKPGSVQASLLTGMLGLQPHPVAVEIIGWLVYLIPVGVFVAWPPGRGLARRTAARVLLAAGVVLGVAAAALFLAAPARQPAHPTIAGTTVVSLGRSAQLRTAQGSVVLRHAGATERRGVAVQVYTGRSATAAPSGLPGELGYQRIAALNGGRLPIGLRPGASAVPATYAASTATTAWIEPRTRRVVDLTRTEQVTVSAGGFALARPVSTTRQGWPAAPAAAAAAASALDRLSTRSLLVGWGRAGAVVAAILLISSVLTWPRRRAAAQAPVPVPELVKVRLG